MNDYDLLGLMDTYNAAKKQGLDVPNSFTEFLTGITPLDDGSNIETPQITQGNSSYEEGIANVEMRAKTADYVTNQLGVGDPIIQAPGNTIKGSKGIEQFIPFNTKPTKANQEAFDHDKRLKTRREIGYDK